MLKSWHIRNFKSFANQPDIPLSAINVLAGANSSGKSSIIQSILLLKQTLQYGSENRSIALNGPLLRLGAFSDVLNHDCGEESIELGFETSFTKEEISAQSSTPWLRAFGRYRSGAEVDSFRAISLRASWTKRPIGSPVFTYDQPSTQLIAPELTEAFLEARRSVSDTEAVSSCRFKRMSTKAAQTDDPLPAEIHVELDAPSVQELVRYRPEGRVWGGFLSHFLPEWIAVRFNKTARRAIQTAETICGLGAAWVETPGNEELPDDVVKVVNSWLEARGRPAVQINDQVVTTSTLRDAIRAEFPRSATNPILLGSRSREDQAALTSLAVLIQEAIMQSWPVEYGVEYDSPRVLDEAGNFVREFFKHGVRYLGPLRDSPRPVYQPEALESTTDVGYRGEHTAAILDLNSDKDVNYIAPPEEDSTTSPEFRRARKGLHAAAVEWLIYLGVASNLVTNDAGVYGHRLQVTTHSDGQFHDLTNVGVGVSQVLPIVVMALLAPRGSLLIFEQPELHLHPKVQARLADFFIALALDYKQLILETHSEYLVDRFRLRIAQSPDDRLRSLTNILFSEKIGSESRLLPIKVNEYGAIANWPSDFFEQSQRDVNRIIRAASAKRRSKKSD